MPESRTTPHWIDSKVLCEEIDRQRLLFDVSPAAERFDHGSAGSIAAGLSDQGFFVCREIPTVQQAFTLAMSAIAELGKQEPYSSLGFKEFRLAKADRIPVCDRVKIAQFQCLHFDYGLPVLPWGQQALYGVVALYKPPGSERSSAETRIVHLNALKKATHLLTQEEIGRRLREYVTTHGDGWRQPELANTGRISILLRFLDAVFGRREFASLIESDSANFLSDAIPDSGAGTAGLEQERTLLQEFGIDLDAVEERVCLEPGDMLLFDNIATVHGRVGRRQPRELWQMLFGLPNLTPAAVDRAVGIVCTLTTSERPVHRSLSN
jgi:hypothetical protein